MPKLSAMKIGLRVRDNRSLRPAATFETIEKRRTKKSDPFYSSAGWIALRDRVRREARGRCEWPGCTHHGRWVDHRVERRDGGPDLDRANVWLLCSSHHTSKTAAEREKRLARLSGA